MTIPLPSETLKKAWNKSTDTFTQWVPGLSALATCHRMPVLQVLVSHLGGSRVFGWGLTFCGPGLSSKGVGLGA